MEMKIPMTRRLPVARLLAGLMVLAFASLTYAQEARIPEITDAKPRYKTLPNNRHVAQNATLAPPGATLRQWNGTFTDITKRQVNYTMVGTNPATTNASSTIPVYIIPVKMVYGATNGNLTFDPVSTTVSNGLTVVNNLIASPIFKKGINFTQGSTNLGTTQYIDAFQRGNFWKYVQTHTGYHVLLGRPVVLPMQTITVSKSQGKVVANPFGSGVVGTFGVNAFDAKLQTMMKNLPQITPGALPLFVTYDIYLTDSKGCCIGGFHSADGGQPGGQTYAYSTYVGSKGAFSEDVSAVSHEVGEWMDDPFVDNHVNCYDNSSLEVGDPLEGNPLYGTFPYSHNGFTYHLQSLVFLGYFGAPRTTSVHSWLAFQNDESNICPGQ
jgi:hypothetical protein